MGRRDDKHQETDIDIGIALGLGHSYESAGEITGTSKSTVVNHRDCPLMLSTKAKTAAYKGTLVADAVESSKEAWLKELRRRRGKYLDLADKLVDKAQAEGADPDLILKGMKAMGDLADRDPETMRGQKTEVSGEVIERKIYELPPELVRAWVESVREMKSIPESPLEIAGEVIDADPV